MIDKVIDFGTTFDWIGPLFSFFSTTFGGLEGYKIHADYYTTIQQIARQRGIKIHNEAIYGNAYVFDLKPGDWAKIQQDL